MTDNQGDREGRPYNTTMPPTNPVYCTGGPRGRPGLRLHGCPDASGHPKSLDFARLLEYHRHRLVTDVTIITSKDREFQFMHDREAMRWLQLTYKVPSEPSQKRVWVWRRLQNLGAFALQNSVYLLPFSDEVEKQFRQLVQEIREMGGEASIFLVEALDAADEKRILQVVTEARNNEYLTVVKVCKRFLAKALAVVESQGWNDQLHAEFAEVLEKVHVLFRTAKRHDMLGSLTASGRADAAEALSACEQVFRMLLDQEYLKARRILEQHSDLLPDEQSAQEQAGENGRMSASLPAQSEHHQVSAVGDEPGLPELPI